MTLRERKERDIATIAAIVRMVLLIAVIAAIVFGGLKVFFFLMPIVVGLVLSTAAVATAKWLIRQLQKLPFINPKESSLGKNRLQRGLSIFIYILLFILIGLLISFVISFIIRFLSTISREIPAWIGETSLIDHLMGAINSISTSLGGVLNSESLESVRLSLQNIQDNVMQSLPQLLTRLLTIITGLFSSLPRLILVTVIMIMSGYYFIVQTDRLYKLSLRIVPDRKLVRKIFNLIVSLTSTLFRILGGFILLMIITFIETYIGFLIIHMPNALTWAIVTAIVDVLPILGISFTMIPMFIVFLITGEVFLAIGVLVLFIVMTILRRIIEPAIIGNAMHLHPLVTILSMIVGIAVMGLGGILVGPLLFFVAREIFVTFDMEKRLRNTIGEFLSQSKLRTRTEKRKGARIHTVSAPESPSSEQ